MELGKNMSSTLIHILSSAFFFFHFSFSVPILANSSTKKESDSIRRLILLGNYISGDYQEAVKVPGSISNKDEYLEMKEFSQIMEELYSPYKKTNKEIFKLIGELRAQIEAKKKSSLVKAKAKAIVAGLKKAHNLLAVLPSVPNLKNGRTHYEGLCATCHAKGGDSNTPMAAALSPPPRNLIEKEFYADLSPSRVHNTLKLGIDGTSMISYENILSEKDKWDVAFYVTSLPFLNEIENKPSEADTKILKEAMSAFTWTELADLSASQLRAKLSRDFSFGDKLEKVFIHLRKASFDKKSMSLKAKDKLVSTVKKKGGLGALRQTREMLSSLLKRGKEGSVKDLPGEVLDIYLEGFEDFERELKILAPKKLVPLEKRFMNLRKHSKETVFDSKLEAEILELDKELEELEVLFSAKAEGKGFSSVSEVLSSVTIIVREGLEAFLIVMALLSLVQNLGVRSAKRWIHTAWISAILLGFLTYFLMNKVFEMSGASRELLEAVLTGVAVLMLFYTGFWLLSQSGSRKWNHFVKGESKNELTQGNLWTFFGLAFVAVYREAAETVLFYGALLNTAQSKSMVILGFFIGVFMLLVLCLGILYYNVKIPLNKFFKMTSSLMFVLSFILMGKAVYELIESGLLVGSSLESFPRIEAFGLYPFKETVFAQIFLLILTGILLYRFKLANSAEGESTSKSPKTLNT